MGIGQGDTGATQGRYSGDTGAAGRGILNLDMKTTYGILIAKEPVLGFQYMYAFFKFRADILAVL